MAVLLFVVLNGMETGYAEAAPSVVTPVAVGGAEILHARVAPTPTPTAFGEEAQQPVQLAGEAASDALLGAIESALPPGVAENVAVVVLAPGGEVLAEIAPEREYYAASLFKLAVLYEAMLRRTHGELDFAQPLALTGADLAEDLGTSHFIQASDGGLTVGDCVYAMVTYSDNACAVALMRVFGTPNIDETLRSLGIEDMSVSTYALPTTAKDMARLMEAVWLGEGLGATEAAEARELLVGQRMRYGIHAGLPAAVKAGSKWGQYDGALHDVAFVEAPFGTYIVAVLSYGYGGWNAVADVSEAVYEALERAG